ncbi:site-specific integrase [Pseudochryseolinea flava]|uniref:Site-specific integrase n=1 Tax=Pseudochryseolinea flava TaxID=2059302 RepID=A0A364Y2S3_9BACT|nr:site-specific integrase [Pseudochryseolinea flava]RAW01080.1 site-specific integrase [Pseudochryseolinea flava]
MKTETYSVIATIKHEKRMFERGAIIYIRITINGKRTEISIKRKIERERWDSNAGRVKGTKEDAREINSLIDTWIFKIHKAYKDLIQKDHIVNGEMIKNILLGINENKKSLLQAFVTHNEIIRSRIGIDFSKSTFTRYETTKDHVSNFLKYFYKVEDVLFDKLSYSFITDFEHYLKVVRKCNHNSTLKYIRNFRKIINDAVRRDWLHTDPFKAYKVKLKDTKRTFLTKEELQAIEQKVLGNERLTQVRDVFVFCCYTGLAHVDVTKLSPKQIVLSNDGQCWINIDRTKTGNPSNIPLLPKALQLIEKYKANPMAVSRNKSFPVITNQRMNGYLKEVATLCGIDKKLTFHVARHTFATTVTLSNGISLETVSSMLGHKNFKTTQIYAKVVQEKISAEMKELQRKLSDASGITG